MACQAHVVGADSGAGVVFADFHFSFRIDSFHRALACSSEPLNGLSVPRDLRYASFVILDIVHLRTGGAVLFESYSQLSSRLLAPVYIRSF